MSWQILEGLNKIPITIFEASSNVIQRYDQDLICLEGHELVDEIGIFKANPP